MAGVGPSTSFRISPVDRRCRKIDPAVLAAAEQIIPRAVSHGMELLGDLAVIANFLEEAAAVFSRKTSVQPVVTILSGQPVYYRLKLSRMKPGVQTPPPRTANRKECRLARRSSSRDLA